jgi:hypothetical protein
MTNAGALGIRNDFNLSLLDDPKRAASQTSAIPQSFPLRLIDSAFDIGI